jgi:hypothetical protein
MSGTHHRRSLRQHLADLHGHSKNPGHVHNDSEPHGHGDGSGQRHRHHTDGAAGATPRIACMHVRALGGCCSSSVSPT